MKTIKKIAFTASVLLYALSMQSFRPDSISDFNFENDGTSEKIMSKEFATGEGASLNVVHSFGNVKVVAWNNPKIKVDVFVRYEPSVSNTKTYAANNYRLDISQRGSNVSIATKHLTNRIKYTISYVVYAPKTTTIDIKNSYGDVAIGNLDGYINLTNSYGDIYCERLGSRIPQRPNTINASYGDITIKEATTINVNVSYGSFSCQSMDAINIKGSYSDLKINSAKVADVSLTYSDAKIGSLSVIKGKMNGGDLKIDRLTETLELVASYTDINVYSIPKNFRNIVLNTTYSNGKLFFENGSSFHLAASSLYSNFKLYNVNGGSQSYEKSFSLNVGNGGNKRVTITSSYGDWTLRRN